MANLIAIDTGLSALGWAAWKKVKVTTSRRDPGSDPRPPDSCGIISVPSRIARQNRSSDPKVNKVSWVGNAEYLHGRFREVVLELYDPDVVAIEWPEFRSGTSKGLAAAAGDALTKLAMCAGCHAEQAWSYGATPRLVPVNHWKGMLPKDTVERRIDRAVGLIAADGSKVSSHAVDAVGIGFYAMGYPMDHACFSRGVL